MSARGDKIFDVIKNNNIVMLSKMHDNGAYIDGVRYQINDPELKNSPIPLHDICLIHLACYYDAFECMVYLLEHGSSPEQESVSGFRPIHYACLGGSLECCSYLCLQDIDLNHVPEGSFITPMYLATFALSPDVVKLLFNSGAVYPDKIKTKFIHPDFMPIKLAIQLKNAELIEIFINNNAKADHNVTNHETVLMKAIAMKMTDTIEILLKNGCNPSFISRRGRSALSLACFHKMENVVQLLVNYGANTRAKFENGKSFLHLACASGCPSIVKLALEAGCKVDETDDFKKIPSFYVQNTSQPESIEIFQMLVSYGLNLNSLWNGIPVLALMFATKGLLPELVQFFLDNGADMDLMMPTKKTVFQNGMICAQPVVKAILTKWRQSHPPKE